MRTRRNSPLKQHAAADLYVHESLMARDFDFDGFRRCFVAQYESLKCCGSVAITLTTPRLLRAGFEDCVDSFAGALPGCDATGERWRKDAVNANGSNALGVLAHVRQRKICSIRDSVDVPFRNM